MANQPTSTTALRYALQPGGFGVVPTTGWQELRMTGESLAANTGTVRSQEILANRQSGQTQRVSTSSQGGFNVEWHYGQQMLDFLELALGGSWTSGVLQVGNSLPFVAVEKAFPVAGKYMLFSDCVVGGMTLQAELGALVTGGFTLLGNHPALNSAQTHTPGNPAAINSNPIWGPIDHIQVIEEAGASLDNVLGFSLNVNNNPRAQEQLGTLGPIDVVGGTFELTGTLRVYLNSTSAALITKYLNYTATDLRFKMGGASSLNLDFEIPAVKYTSCPVVAQGPNGDVIVDLGWSAEYDATLSTLQITETP